MGLRSAAKGEAGAENSGVRGMLGLSPGFGELTQLPERLAPADSVERLAMVNMSRGIGDTGAETAREGMPERELEFHVVDGCNNKLLGSTNHAWDADLLTLVHSELQ
jgi:hypothetical protein